MADHKRKKKRGRSKLFRSCFRSFAADERPLLNDKSDNRNSKTGPPGKPFSLAVSGREGGDFIPDGINGTAVDCTGERSSNGRRIPRLLKAVLFDSVMVKKIRSSSKSSIASDTCESFQSIEKSGKESNDRNASCMESTDMEDSSTRCSNSLSSSSRTASSSYTSSSSSSTNSNSRWLSDLPDSSSLQKPNLINSNSRSYSSSQTVSIHLSRQNTSISLPLAKSTSLPRSTSHRKGSSQSQSDSVDSSTSVSPNSDKIKSGCNNWNVRWCLFLLLSFVVLVVYGRIYSILCTSMWFYLVPCGRVKRVNSVTNTVGFTDTESEQYKKRVIMSGLLDRTRNPLR